MTKTEAERDKPLSKDVLHITTYPVYLTVLPNSWQLRVNPPTLIEKTTNADLIKQ